jgi:hypothetical protein
LERIGGATQDFLWFGTIKCRAWVAAVDAITGTRRFLRPVLDYRAANQKGTRGVYATYILKPGEIYEVANPTSWSTTERYHCVIVNGERVRVTADTAAQRVAILVQHGWF